jgi:hypothetical protein
MIRMNQHHLPPRAAERGQARVVITFSEAERAMLWRLARLRHEPKAARGIKPLDWRPRDGRSVLTKHYDGLRGEYAVAKWTGAELDTRISLSGNGRSHNLVLPDGRRVDVRYRNRRGWDFGLRGLDLRDFGGDIGVLVWPAPEAGPDAVELAGWCTREDFLLHCHLTQYGPHGPRLSLAPIWLRPMSTLLSVPARAAAPAAPMQLALWEVNRDERDERSV